jgi:hypothetical protein
MAMCNIIKERWEFPVGMYSGEIALFRNLGAAVQNGLFTDPTETSK